MTSAELEEDAAESVKGRILVSARRIIADEGYSALSMRRVARDVGYSATAIYLHYESKDALVHAVIDDGMDRLYELLTTAADGVDDPRLRLEPVLKAYIAFGLENPEYYEIMFMLHPRPMERYPAENYRRARRNLDIIAGVIQGTLERRMPLSEARLHATSMWSALHGAVALIIAGRVDASIRISALVDRTVRQAMGHLDPLQAKEEA